MEQLRVLEAAAHVDYVRATWRDSALSEQIFIDGHVTLASLCRRLYGDAGRVEPWAWLGYYGRRWETMCLGRGPQGTILQASGPSAQLVADLCRGADNVSRLDVALTAWYEQDPRKMPLQAFAEARRARRDRPGRPPKLELRLSVDGGSTTYVGSRGNSSRLLRVYDKGRESGKPEYARAIRWESEQADEFARATFSVLAETGWAAGAVAATVRSECSRCGVSSVPDMDIPQWGWERLPRDAGSVEKTRNWLRRQVAPALRRLLEEGVSRETILEDLGLIVPKTDEAAVTPCDVVV